MKRTTSPATDNLFSMLQNIIPDNDIKRINALKQYEIFYTPAAEVFDRITGIIAKVFDTPMAFLSLVDKDTVFYKSQASSFG